MPAPDRAASSGAVSSGASSFAVDPDELTALARVLDDLSRSLETAGDRLVRIRAGSGEWAVDGNLPGGLGRLLDALTGALRDAGSGATDLSDRLARAGSGYCAAEATAAGAARGMRSGGPVVVAPDVPWS